MMRTSVYVLRHQHGGYLVQNIFASVPTDAQMEASGIEADKIFGKGWIRVYEVAFLDENEVVSSTEETEIKRSSSNGANFPTITAQGYGIVVNPPGFEP